MSTQNDSTKPMSKSKRRRIQKEQRKSERNHQRKVRVARSLDFQNPVLTRHNSQMAREVEDQVDAKTAQNVANPEMRQHFTALVKQGDEQKLAKYFTQYGMTIEMAIANLPMLIEEELHDLGLK